MQLNTREKSKLRRSSVSIVATWVVLGGIVSSGIPKQIGHISDNAPSPAISILLLLAFTDQIHLTPAAVHWKVSCAVGGWESLLLNIFRSCPRLIHCRPANCQGHDVFLTWSFWFSAVRMHKILYTAFQSIAALHRRNLRVPHFLEAGIPYPHFLGVWQKKITATFPHPAIYISL